MRFRRLRALALAIGLSLAGCAGLPGERPEIDVSLVNLIPIELGLLEQKIEVDVRVRNPNNYPLVLSGMKFDLELSGKRVLRGMSGQRVEIPRLGDAVVKVNGTTTTLSLLRQILDLQENKPISYRMRGTAYLEGLAGGTIPFENAGEVPLAPDRPPRGGR